MIKITKLQLVEPHGHEMEIMVCLTMDRGLHCMRSISAYFIEANKQLQVRMKRVVNHALRFKSEVKSVILTCSDRSMLRSFGASITSTRHAES